jgi:hypothetical protein
MGAVSISDPDNHVLVGWPRAASRRALRPPCGLAPGRMDGPPAMRG